jgi:hypothetical protein
MTRADVIDVLLILLAAAATIWTTGGEAGLWRLT